MDKKEQEIGEEYASSLADLNVNSKPLINMLTILADENSVNAKVIVQSVEEHINKANPDVKLPVLYLIDSIVKNVGGEYTALFSHCIVNIFCGVFEKVNESVREKMFALRQTWNEVFPPQKLYTLDIKTHSLDPGWPITAKVVAKTAAGKPVSKTPSIHVNPNFFKARAENEIIQAQLAYKQRELLELEKRKIELKLEATQRRIEQQEKVLSEQTQTASVKVERLPIQPTSIAPTQSASGPMLARPNVKTRIAPVAPGLLSSMSRPRDPRDPRMARQMVPPPQHHIIAPSAMQMAPKPLFTEEQLREIMPHRPVGGPNGQRIANFPKQNNAHSKNTNSKPARSSRDKESSQSKSRSPSSASASKSGTSRTARTTSSSRSKSSSSSSTSNVKGSTTKTKTSSSTSSLAAKSSGTSTGSSSSPKKKESTSKGSPSSSSKSPSKKAITRRRSVSPSDKERSPKKTSEQKISTTVTAAELSNSSSASSSQTKDVANAVRRNHSKSPSPADCNKDVDLRMLMSSSSSSSDKRVEETLVADETTTTSRAHSSPTPTAFIGVDQKNLIEATANDVDLRVLPPAILPASPATGGIIDPKKRSSEDLSESPASKRTKNEKIDLLFGSEDVDLRSLGPIAPPPPTITAEKQTNRVKDDTVPASSKTQLDAVRAKLAEVARNQEKQTPRTTSTSPLKRARSLLQRTKQDIDLRAGAIDDENSQEDGDAKLKIIMNQAKEQFDSNEIDFTAYNRTLQEVFHLKETEKIKEAKRRESLGRKANTRPDELTPISEDEATFSSDDELPTESHRVPKKIKISDNKETVDSEGNSGDVSVATKPFEKKPRDPNRKRHTKWSPWEQPQMPSQHLIPPHVGPPMNNWKAPPPLMNTLQQPPIPPFLGQRQPIINGPWRNQAPPSLPQFDNSTALRSFSGIPPPPSAPPGMYVPPPNLMNGVTIDSMPPIMNHHPPQYMPPMPVQTQPNMDGMRTLNIDSIPREIRFYDEVALVFMSWDDPKEIGFQPGERRVIVDDSDTFVLAFNDPYKQVIIDGKTYQIRLGSPTRELYIDNVSYECYFGDPPTIIALDGRKRKFAVDGPPPQVRIGKQRTDLVVGQITMIIDASHIVPVFLDAKVQTFVVANEVHTIQFADYLLTALINNEPYEVEYGGLPKKVYLRGRKYFVRFTQLPKNVVAGSVYVKNMVRTQMHPQLMSPPPVIVADVVPPPAIPSILPPGMSAATSNDTGLPTPVDTSTAPPPLMSSIANIFQHNAPFTLPGLSTFVPPPQPAQNTSSYQMEPQSQVESTLSTDAAAPIEPAKLNLDDLFQVLLASGVLQRPVVTEEGDDAKSKKDKESIRPIILSQPETIKTRQAGIVHTLFSGMQCSSCGLRFPPEQTTKYSLHLDWHFRQNRRERDSARRGHSRKWYYDMSDWIKYEEIEDVEEREKNYFETQQNECEGSGEESNQRSDLPPPSCVALPDDVDKKCDMCHDVFETFFNEETEEWHLRPAIRVDEQTYHPLCYDDYKASLKAAEEAALKESLCESMDDNAMDNIFRIKQEKDANESIPQNVDIDDDDDDDDDVIVMPTEEPSITEIPDDDDEVLPNSTDDEARVNLIRDSDGDGSNSNGGAAAPVVGCDDVSTNNADNHGSASKRSQNESFGNESDVEIQEPNIPCHNLDDIEDVPMGESTTQIDEVVLPVKIKSEPKDDGYNDVKDEDDGFEDIGTFEPEQTIEELNDSVDVDDLNIPTVISSSTSSSGCDALHLSLIPTIDGNVEPQEPSASTTQVGVNKIKINITKTIVKQNQIVTNESNTSNNPSPSSNSNLTSNISNLPNVVATDGEEPSHHGSSGNNVENDNSLMGGSTQHGGGNVAVGTAATIDDDASNGGASHKTDDCGGGYGAAAAAAVGGDLVTSSTSSVGSPSAPPAEDAEPEFEYKESLRDVEFKKTPSVKNGFETSGLCSIM